MVPLQFSQLLLHPQGVVAVGAAAEQLPAQLVVGQLEGILALAQQVLQVEVPLQLKLVLAQPGIPRHRHQKGQQLLCITAGTFEAQHQAVFAGFTAQGRAAALHQIGQGFGAVVTTAPGHQPSQQLGSSPLPRLISAAAAPNPEPAGHNFRAGPTLPDQGQPPRELRPLPAGQLTGHAGTASSTQARLGSSRGTTWPSRSWLLQLSISARGRARAWCRPQSRLLPIRPASPPAASRPKR